MWDGKAALLAALGGLCETSPGALVTEPGHDAVVDAVMSAIARKNLAFRTAAVACLKQALSNFQEDYFDKVGNTRRGNNRT